MQSNSKVILSLIIEQGLVLLILLLHLNGFMDISHESLKVQSPENEMEVLIEKSKSFHSGEKQSSKTVLLVIDALRVDHLATAENSFMKYSKELLETKQGIGYLIKTASPTVTLPRIKSIITGSIPNFMDVIFNFASSEIKEENIVHSASKKGLKVAFYGDETWLKLFPKTFNHWEGVTSFYVSDYTEVDNNVTRNLPHLLSNDADWDLLILHYLGLDHIGHFAGPKSSLMGPKLMEMDHVIKRIHEYLKEKGEPYLFLTCGDHGMGDSGGHGGDSHSEIWTSALAMSHLIDNKETSYSSPSQRIRNQVDLASTLALSLGLEIPVQNVGIPLFEVMEKQGAEKQLVAHYRVSKQLMRLARMTQDSDSLQEMMILYETVVKLHHDICLKGDSSPLNLQEANVVLNLYKEFEEFISNMMMERIESYDLPLLLSSSIILIMISVPTIIWTLFLTTEISSPIYEWKMLLITLTGGLFLLCCRWLNLPSVSPSSYVVLVLFTYGVTNLHSFVKCFTTKFYLKLDVNSTVEVAIVIGVLLHPFSLLATSLVEEEHFGFYFMVSLVYLLLVLSLARKLVAEERGGDPKSQSERDAEFIQRDLANSALSSSLVVAPILFHGDSIPFLARGRKDKQVIIHSHSSKRLGHMLLVSFCWALFRMLRAFNATGDKWKHLIHINDVLRETQGIPLALATAYGAGVTFLLFRTYSPVLVLVSVVAIFGRHYPFFEEGVRSGTLEAQIAYVSVCFFCVYNVVKMARHKVKESRIEDTDLVIFLMQVAQTSFALLFLLLQRPENVLAASLSFLHCHLIIPFVVKNRRDFGLHTTHIYVFSFWIAQAHFFAEGNSNSFSTVEINAGFVGITSYLPFVHGALIASHTFGAKFIVLLHVLIVILYHDRRLDR